MRRSIGLFKTIENAAILGSNANGSGINIKLNITAFILIILPAKAVAERNNNVTKE
jgi:hypothetical protein